MITDDSHLSTGSSSIVVAAEDLTNEHVCSLKVMTRSSRLEYRQSKKLHDFVSWINTLLI